MKNYFLINKKLKKLYKIIEEKYLNSPKITYFTHSLRVANYCYQIGTIEKVDLDIIVAAALIHDIGKTICSGFREHVLYTKEEGPKILLECNYYEEEIKKIMQIAISHHPKKDEVLNDIYEQILFDADNLDCVGSFGIIRWYNGISPKLENTISDAKMYIEYFSFENRKRFFYTDYAHKRADHLVKEGIEYANKLIKFCELSIEQNENLFPF